MLPARVEPGGSYRPKAGYTALRAAPLAGEAAHPAATGTHDSDPYRGKLAT
jgi:hypothetical protein